MRKHQFHLKLWSSTILLSLDEKNHLLFLNLPFKHQHLSLWDCPVPIPRRRWGAKKALWRSYWSSTFWCLHVRYKWFWQRHVSQRDRLSTRVLTRVSLSYASVPKCRSPGLWKKSYNTFCVLPHARTDNQVREVSHRTLIIAGVVMTLRQPKMEALNLKMSLAFHSMIVSSTKMTHELVIYIIHLSLIFTGLNFLHYS